MSDKANNLAFQMLAVIATPKLAEKAAKMFQKDAIPVQYRLNAQGTASSEVMDMLGLGSIDKCILLSMMSKPVAKNMLRKLHTGLRLDTINSGIAFTVPLNGINRLLLQMMTETTPEELRQNVRKDDEIVTEAKHTLIVAVINRGFGDNVMDAARAAGAGGGTIMHSRQIGNEEQIRQWGLSIQQEKELVLILAEAENKMSIMRAVSEQCGMQSEAKGLVLSLPIDSVMGI